MQLHPDPTLDPYGNFANIPTIDINSIYGVDTVRGELILVEKRFRPSEVIKSYDQSFVEGIKRELVNELVEKILQNKMVEFTKQEDLNTSEVIYRARAYLTPDDKVQMIRKATL